MAIQFYEPIRREETIYQYLHLNVQLPEEVIQGFLPLDSTDVKMPTPLFSEADNSQIDTILLAFPSSNGENTL